LTINIAIAVAEGLVLAADSMSQMQVGNQVLGTHGSVEKLTEIGDVPVAAMSSGLGAIANRTILSLIREFEFNHYATPAQAAAFRALTVQQITDDLAMFFDSRYLATYPVGSPMQPVLRIVIGGYSPQQFFPEIFELTFPGKVVRQTHPQPGGVPGAGTIYWAGMPVALNRLIKGVDLEALAAARDLLTNAARPGFVPIPGAPPLPPPAAADPVATAAHYDAFIQMPHNLDGMPLEEAVEFADYLGTVAIGYDRFTVGPPGIGGELDVLAIQPEGLSWYRRKKFAAQMALARRR
jgi:hypothetical protein